MKFIVFGLGNYGAALSTKLVALGHEVIGVDLKLELVEKWKNQITYTIALDAGSLEGVKSLPLKETDVIINAIGEGEGANIMLTALLKQLNAGRIICRVISPLQKTVLEAMGIQEFAYPEADSAERMAHTLDLKGVVDSYKVSDDYQLIDVAVPERYIDKKIFEVNFQNYDVQPVTIIRTVDERNIFGTIHKVKKVVGILTPSTTLKKGDRLLLFGEVSKLETFVEA
jgi:trk system potassium uptake protein